MSEGGCRLLVRERKSLFVVGFLCLWYLDFFFIWKFKRKGTQHLCEGSQQLHANDTRGEKRAAKITLYPLAHEVNPWTRSLVIKGRCVMGEGTEQDRVKCRWYVVDERTFRSLRSLYFHFALSLRADRPYPTCRRMHTGYFALQTARVPLEPKWYFWTELTTSCFVADYSIGHLWK